MYSRFFNPPNSSFFLFGPRGTGKSFLIQRIFPDGYLIDLLLDNTYQKFLIRPSLLNELIEAHPKIKVWIIDEVQRIPELLPLVHHWIEKKKKLQFILTGSSARKLKRKGVDLLSGRALDLKLHGYLASELGEDFSLDKALQFGMLPLVWGAKSKQKTLDSYLSLYMQLEVQAEGLIRHISTFAKFLEVISFSHGQLLNFSHIARDCGVDAKTVRNYVEILEDVLLSFRLPVFLIKAKRKLIQHEKFYYFDVGIYKSIRPQGPLDDPHIITGPALEGLILQQLRAWVDYRNKKDKLFFWRSQNGVEVDVIIYGPSGLYAFEIKSSKYIRDSDLRGLHEFKSDYPIAQCIFLYRGEEKLKRGNILILPVAEFLKNLNPNLDLKNCF